MTAVSAVRALRWNYRWRGVRVWLGTTHKLTYLTSERYQRSTFGEHRVRGWWLVVRYPRAVVAEQMALAEGICS